MKRMYGMIAVVLIVLSVITMIYLMTVDLNVVGEERGTLVDPATYMTSRQLEQAEDYSRIRYIIYFLNIPYEWGIYLLILGLGISARFRKWVEEVHRWSIIQAFFYIFLFSLLTTLLFIPIQGLRFFLGHFYGVTTQSLSSWIGDLLKGFWMDLFITVPVVWGLFGLIRKSPRRWWVYAWLLSIPLILFLSFIQPIVLDPVYNDFYPLKDETLKEQILALADEANIPAEQVYEVDMSTKTKAMNAYVTGIGASTRIVLWDTTLQKLTENEILFIMAHEMGHYVAKDVFWSILASIGVSFIFLWLINKILQWVIPRVGQYWGIRNIQDIAVLPLILLIVSVLSFVSDPVSNWVQRSKEHKADVYALELTQDPEAMISSFQKMTAEGLSYPNPPGLVRFFMYTHPTIVERIRFASQYETKETQSD